MQNYNANLREDSFTKEVEGYTASLPSFAYLGIAAAAMGASLLFQVTGRGKWGNFVAQWAPTWLILGLYNKLVKLEGHDRADRGEHSVSQDDSGRLPLKDFINYRVETVQPSDSLKQAAEKMRALDIGSLPVCDGQHLVGVITDRDIAIRSTADGQDPSQTKVEQVMTPEAVYCFENDDVQQAANKMQEHQIRRIFVVDEDRDLVGITSLGEIATITKDRELAGETLRRVSEQS
jgi:CBS domain-containing protein